MTATIFALASGAGRAGVAVIRVSGPDAGRVLAALQRRGLPGARVARKTRLWSAAGEVLDNALVLWFPAPHSFTGEDVAELHVHGGRAVIAAVSEALVGWGLRPAEPGEFSRRAFENGKMDLTEAEGLADLVAAETAAQRRLAVQQLGGALSDLYEGWRADLVRALAHLEAAIDFPEDGLPDDLAAEVQTIVRGLVAEIDRHLADGHRGELLRDGVHIAIVGAPNVGKSSLLNRLARRDAAIVAATAGTTRDVVEVHLDLGGFPVVVADTAGLRDGGEEVEREGMRRARARAAAAALTVVVFDGRDLPGWDAHSRALVDPRSLVVVNKVDLIAADAVPATLDRRPVYGLSAASGEGVDAFLGAVLREVARLMEGGGGPVLTRARHRAALEECRAALARLGSRSELAAEDLRLAARALGRITGRVDVEELLDVIFRDFCLGK